MLPGMELMGCTDLAVPAEVMHHIVSVESSYNPYAIGVVGGRLARQPRNLPEAVATAQMLESRGYNFSLGLAQVNRYNLKKYGIDSYERAFGKCANLSAGASILAECHSRSKGDWGNAFSCYYSGNFVTGYRHGYVQRVFASMGLSTASSRGVAEPIDLLIQARSAPRPASAQGAASPRPNALAAWRSGDSTSTRSQPLARAQAIAGGAAPDASGPMPAGTNTEEQRGVDTAASATLSPPAQAMPTQPATSDAATVKESQQQARSSDSAFVF